MQTSNRRKEQLKTRKPIASTPQQSATFYKYTLSPLLKRSLRGQKIPKKQDSLYSRLNSPASFLLPLKKKCESSTKLTNFEDDFGTGLKKAAVPSSPFSEAALKLYVKKTDNQNSKEQKKEEDAGHVTTPETNLEEPRKTRKLVSNRTEISPRPREKTFNEPEIVSNSGQI